VKSKFKTPNTIFLNSGEANSFRSLVIDCGALIRQIFLDSVAHDPIPPRLLLSDAEGKSSLCTNCTGRPDDRGRGELHGTVPKRIVEIKTKYKPLVLHPQDLYAEPYSWKFSLQTLSTGKRPQSL
jgi:hypothetical protein